MGILKDKPSREPKLTPARVAVSMEQQSSNMCGITVPQGRICPLLRAFTHCRVPSKVLIYHRFLLRLSSTVAPGQQPLGLSWAKIAPWESKKERVAQ